MVRALNSKSPYLPELSRIRARYLVLCVALIVVAPLILTGFVSSTYRMDRAFAWTLEQATFAVVYLILGAYLFWRASVSDLVQRICAELGYGVLHVLRYLILGFPLICIGYAGIYILYLPLSYAAPEFVEEVLLAVPTLFLWQLDSAAVAGNAIAVFTLLVFAPIVEEVLFRGFLLARWQAKYGTKRAILFSSVLFGLLHFDPIGALLFSVVLSLMALRTGSLLGPIIAHAANNLFVVGFVLIESGVSGTTVTYSLAEFQNEWWIAVICGAIGIPWLLVYARRIT